MRSLFLAGLVLAATAAASPAQDAMKKDAPIKPADSPSKGRAGFVERHWPQA